MQAHSFRLTGILKNNVNIQRRSAPKEGKLEQIGIVQDAWNIFEPELAEQGYELVEVEYVHEYGSMILRMYIDKDGGINVDDCAEASRMISALMDQADFVGSEYVLEISSPGIERPLRKPEDFVRFIGESIKVKTTTPIEGRRRYKGTLSGFEDGLIALDVDGTTHRIHIENVKRAKLDR